MTVEAEDRKRIMMAAVRHAAFDGWTDRILAQGARDAGYSADAAERAFPGGVDDLIVAFSEWADTCMADALVLYNLSALNVGERVALGVRLRLECLAPHREAVRRLTAHCALPGNASLGARLVARTVDAIWYAAGDTATDFSYYTKRGLLAAVYGSTVLYWLGDESEGRVETWGFLERRLEDTMRVRRLGGSIERMLDKLPSPFRLWRVARRRGPI